MPEGNRYMSTVDIDRRLRQGCKCEIEGCTNKATTVQYESYDLFMPRFVCTGCNHGGKAVYKR